MLDFHKKFLVALKDNMNVGLPREDSYHPNKCNENVEFF